MKIEIEKKHLLDILGKTQNIVEKRNTMPVLANVLLEADNNSLRVFATDLEVSLTDNVPAKVLTAGKVAVSARSLFDLVKELSDGTIQLIKKENNWLEIKQNKFSSKIVGVSADEYPVFPIYSGDEFTKIDPSTLAEMIDKTLYSVSNDETRYHLNGVYFERTIKDSATIFRMVATDGHRLSVIDRNTEQKTNSLTSQPQGVIIPRKGLQEIKKIVESNSDTIEMAIEGSQLVIRSKSAILMIRLIEGKYPNYQQLIPTKLSNQIHLKRDLFLSSLKRVSLLANQKSKGVTLTLTPGKMEISSNNPELGDAKEEIEIDYKGKEIKVGFNAKYITDILNSISEDEIDFEINDQLSPGLMRPHNDKSYTCVVMPMRI